MNKIMVIGGAGYVGTVLSEKLCQCGYDVHIVDLFWFGNNLSPELHSKSRKMDAFELTVEDMRGFDVVVFVAGLSNDPMADFSPSKNFISNSACPAYLAYIAKKAGVRRFVYASSCSIYGYTSNELFDETGPTLSQFPYGISKLQGERAVLQLADDTFSVIALRKGTVAGPSPRMRFDLVVNAMFKNAITTGQITVNNPTIWRPILGIFDCANAYKLAITHNKHISGMFNIASENCTIGKIAEIVKNILAKYSIKTEIITNNLPDVRNYKVTWAKASSLIHYIPRQTIASIVEQLYQQKSKYPDMTLAKYHNIQIFQNF